MSPDLQDFYDMLAQQTNLLTQIRDRLPGTTPAPPGPPSPPDPPNPPAPPPGTRPYFTGADWMWTKIPPAPQLDPVSDVWSRLLAQGQHVAETDEYGVTLIRPDQITPSTPRYTIPLTAGWGSTSAFNGVPIPDGTTTAPGGDKALAIFDASTSTITSLWLATPNGNGGWTAAAGSQLPVTSDGREKGGDTSVGSNLARFGCVVRRSEVASGLIPHALFFATDMVMAGKSNFRYPATKTDGSNHAGVGSPIPEGARVQLDPLIDLTQIAGITPFELAVGRALQDYGAYVGDNGGARMAFSCERGDYSSWGASDDYYNFPRLPWGSLRVLRQWDGR